MKIANLPDMERKVMRAIIKAWIFKNGKNIPTDIGLEQRCEVVEQLLDN
ncbi:MAG: hypothetical protein ACTSPD_09970 [Promethearchaeota archaeon]